MNKGLLGGSERLSQGGYNHLPQPATVPSAPRREARRLILLARLQDARPRHTPTEASTA